MTTTTRDRTRRVRSATAGVLLVAVALGLHVTPVGGQSSATLPGLGGGSLAPSDLARGTHVIVVWASWSPRCRDIVPRVNEIASRFGGRARVVTVNFQEEPAAIEQFLAGKSLTVPVYLDRSGDFSKAHAVTTLPGLIVYRDGEVRFQGRLEADAAGQIEPLLR
jgi:thiol-disulfide isomerase/thioredoxin